MTDRSDDRDPTGSDDLVDEAWDRLSGGGSAGTDRPPEADDSDTLVSDTWKWLERGSPSLESEERGRAAEPPAEPEEPETPQPVPPATWSDVFPVPSPPAERRPSPTPVRVPGAEPEESSRRGPMMLAILGLIALMGIGVAVLFAAVAGTETGDGATATTTAVDTDTGAATDTTAGETTLPDPPLVITVESPGTAFAVNPCTAEDIEGRVTAQIDYRETGDAEARGAAVSILVTGEGLKGSEGNDYAMELLAMREFTETDGTFTMPAESLVWTWGDGQRFVEEATVVVEVEGDKLTSWGFESTDGICDSVACPVPMQPTCGPWSATTAALISAGFTGDGLLAGDPEALDEGVYRKYDIAVSVPDGTTIEWRLASDPADAFNGAITTQDPGRTRLTTVTWMPAAAEPTPGDLTVLVDHTLNEIKGEDAAVPARGPIATWDLVTARFSYRIATADLDGTAISGAIGARYCPDTGRVVMVSSWRRGVAADDEIVADLLPVVTTLEC